MRDKWNRRYQEKGPQNFGTEPSGWLQIHSAHLQSLPKGKALDIACGNGRNARFLAQLGFEVDALDISDVAIDWLSQKVKEANLSINPKTVDLTQYQLPVAQYQVVLNFNYLDRALYPSIQQALMPGGVLFFETFTAEQIHTLGGSISPAFVLNPNELLHAFPSLHILHYREGIFGKDKQKAIASLLGQKK